jgi:H+/Cl- antiporter ClcA/CBS domain-containing protein
MEGTAEPAQDRLSDFSQDRRVLILSLMALVIGSASAIVAWALLWLIAVITNLAFYGRYSSVLPSLADHRLGNWVILIPVLGGLVIGLMARYGSEKIRGHGIPEALEAILVGRSRMEPRVAVLKPLSSAISIGTGGPFGAEGPIIMTGGALGSLFAQLFHLSSAERKTLLVAGAAGGMSAVFGSPVAAVLLAVELLLFEWRPRSLVPVAISAAIAFALRVPLLGGGPIFPVPTHAPLNLEGLVLAFALGIAAGLCSSLLTILVYGCEDAFGKLPLHWMWWPTIGGLFVGIGGLIDPRILGVGYGTIHDLLRGDILGAALIGLFAGKALVWSIALGSGTSGGVLAPLLMMGAALGALGSQIVPMGDAGLWATIGMAAMMGGTMRSPLTAMVFTLELTHDLNLLPALLAACIASYAVNVLLMRRSILTEKVARRGFHIMREYSVDPFVVRRVGDVMDSAPPTVPATMNIGDLSNKIAQHDPEFTRHRGLFIVDDKNRLEGVITPGDIVRAIEEGSNSFLSVLEAGNRDVIVTYPDEVLYDAVEKMLRNNVGRLPVVSRQDPRRLVGYLGRVNIMTARLRQMEEEHVREKGIQF